MKSLYINPDTNDLEFDAQNNFTETIDHEEEVQAVRLLLTTNTNEFFLNTLHGLAYEYFQVKIFDEERARLALIEALSQEPRFSDLLESNFDFDRINRKLTVAFTALMNTGNTVEGEVAV